MYDGLALLLFLVLVYETFCSDRALLEFEVSEVSLFKVAA